jgi:hypothetical protein
MGGGARQCVSGAGAGTCAGGKTVGASKRVEDTRTLDSRLRSRQRFPHHVELARGELGVVREVDALVAELAAHLVDAVEAADDELLEVELGRDAHEEVQVQVVVVPVRGRSESEYVSEHKRGTVGLATRASVSREDEQRVSAERWGSFARAPRSRSAAVHT